VPCIDEGSGEQRVDSSRKNIAQNVIVADVNKHLSYKVERIKKWMSREGLEDERKWMTDTESVFGASLLSPFSQDTAHERDLRERAIRGDVDAAHGMVPRQFWPVLEAARADPKVIDNNSFNNITRRHTRGGFKRMVRSMVNGSVPGGSGFSYAELKCMSEKVLWMNYQTCVIYLRRGRGCIE
jgi:hypothetical protein